LVCKSFRLKMKARALRAKGYCMCFEIKIFTT
jgi:hypothetical protein